jgi:hypothetical protein
MGSIEGLHHLDAEAAIVREEHGELGHVSQGLRLKGFLAITAAICPMVG